MCLTLEPGDVIVMGTPAGVGQARTPPVWMKAGDTIEIEIERVGTLSNPIVAEAAMSDGRDAYDVAIVGFGPSGAVAAGLLGQAGLQVYVCEQLRGRLRDPARDRAGPRDHARVPAARRGRRDRSRTASRSRPRSTTASTAS